MRISHPLITVSLALSSLAAGGCASSSAGREGGCAETFCDLARKDCKPTPCANPCRDCWDECRTIDITYAAQCADVCSRRCDRPSPPCTNSCDDDLRACRQMARNKVCVDGALTPRAASEPPCGGALKDALCECHDKGCELELLGKSAACKTCAEGYVTACLEAACKAEWDAAGAVATEDCQTWSCLERTHPDVVNNFRRCFVRAQADPADVGGCYSGARVCFGEDPFCAWEKVLLAD